MLDCILIGGGPAGSASAADCWFWLIPMSIEPGGRNTTSVGVVVDRAVRDAWHGEPLELMERLFAASAVVRERIAAAKRLTPAHVEADFSYRDRVRAAALAGSAKTLFQSVDTYTRFVRAFYTQPWYDIFLADVESPRIKKAVVRVLAGDVAGMNWWLRMFFLVIWAQKKWGIVPPVPRPTLVPAVLEGRAAPSG